MACCELVCLYFRTRIPALNIQPAYFPAGTAQHARPPATLLEDILWCVTDDLAAVRIEIGSTAAPASGCASGDLSMKEHELHPWSMPHALSQQLHVCSGFDVPRFTSSFMI
jgi:hypothetical protein